MTDQHPITPPPELVKEWTEEGSYADGAFAWGAFIATQAARWGYQQCMKLDAAWLEAKLQKARDQELEACCEWLEGYAHCGYSLRAARRPKSLSPKDQVRQALAALSRLNSGSLCANPVADKEIIRRALEQLDD